MLRRERTLHNVMKYLLSISNAVDVRTIVTHDLRERGIRFDLKDDEITTNRKSRSRENSLVSIIKADVINTQDRPVNSQVFIYTTGKSPVVVFVEWLQRGSAQKAKFTKSTKSSHYHEIHCLISEIHCLKSEIHEIHSPTTKSTSI